MGWRGEGSHRLGHYRQTKSDHRTFVHFTRSPSRAVILSRAKNLTVRPFASLRVTDKCANLVWFDLVFYSRHCTTNPNAVVAVAQLGPGAAGDTKVPRGITPRAAARGTVPTYLRTFWVDNRALLQQPVTVDREHELRACRPTSGRERLLISVKMPLALPVLHRFLQHGSGNCQRIIGRPPTPNGGNTGKRNEQPTIFQAKKVDSWH
jgi:hypothetical protein